MADELDMSYITRVVRQAQSGDSNAFAELYVATYPRLYRFSYRYLHDKYLAQDALQETYIRALQHLNQLQEPGLIICWLGQINMRICYRMLKKQESVLDDEAMAQMPDVRKQADPENETVQIDYNEYLMKQILNLPFTESQVLLLRFYHNMKLGEIAKMLEISLSTVKRSLNSGMKRLRNSVER